MTNDKPRSMVKSIDTTLDVIQYLHCSGSATIEEIAEAVSISTSTVHRHLVTLRERGYVIIEDGEHRLSFMFLTHGGKVRDKTFAADMVNKKVQQIAERTEERAQFIIEENGERVYLFTHFGSSGVKTDANVGKRGPLHISAAGKAILAHLPQERIEEILDNIKFDRLTEQTITTPTSLEAELEEIREQNYAFNDEELTESLRAVGVPIRLDNGAVYGAISVSGPAHRFSKKYFREELPELLLGAANEIELNLKYS